MTDPIFAALVADHEPPDLERPSLAALWRNLRIRFVPRTISAHNDELGAVTRFPLGFTWRRWHGSDWCPVCLSIAPHSLLGDVAEMDYWDRDESVAEMTVLIERGEMSTDGAWNKVANPPPGTAYGIYNFNPHLRAPDTLMIAVGEQRVGFVMAHLYDIPVARRSLLLGHLNRLAPQMEWAMDRHGGLTWATTGLALVTEGDPDDPDPEPDEPDTPSDPDPQGDPS